MADVSLRDERVQIINFCPDTTLEQLYRDCELMPPVNAESTPAFAIRFQWGAGVDSDAVYIMPGEKRWEPHSLGRQMVKDCGERGIAMVSVPKNAKEMSEEDIRMQELRQVERAMRQTISFYAQNGLRRLSMLARRRGLNDEALESMREEHYGYYLNERRKELIEKQLGGVLEEQKAILRRKQSGKAPEMKAQGGARA